jgi:peptidoglycan/LPS O-acetylase OafA/YrhL
VASLRAYVRVQFLDIVLLLLLGPRRQRRLLLLLLLVLLALLLAALEFALGDLLAGDRIGVQVLGLGSRGLCWWLFVRHGCGCAGVVRVVSCGLRDEI